MEEDSKDNVHAEFLARFQGLCKRTEDQSGEEDSVSSSQNLNENSAGSSTQNQPVSPSSTQNQPLPLTTGPNESQSAILPDAQFSTSSNPNSIRAGPVLKNEEGKSLQGTSGQHNDTQETGTSDYYSAQIKLMQPDQIIGMAMEFSGSWLLRNALAENNPDSISRIFDGLIGCILNLAMHPSGCYVLISLTQACNVDQLGQIIRNLILPPPRIVQVSLHLTGSKTIRRLIQLLKRSSFIEPVVSALATGFNELMQDQQGALVIHCCLAQLSSQQNEVLYRAALRPFQALGLATDKRGCIELNRFINGVSGPCRDLLLHTITDSTVFLSQDPTGNFVIQHILDLQHPVLTHKLCALLQGYYVRLSFLKNGSHIVEKCLNSSDLRFAVLDLVNSKRLSQVAHDQFGNYVIQTALKVTQEKDRTLYDDLRKALEPHLASLASHQHGKNVFKFITDAAPPM